jgi:nuclear transport factor 2 (NTF2) superfamily protein
MTRPPLPHFDEPGLMRRRIASINDLPIEEHDRAERWPRGRPDDSGDWA